MRPTSDADVVREFLIRMEVRSSYRLLDER